MIGLFLLKPQALVNPLIEADIMEKIRLNFEILSTKLVKVDREIFLAHQPKVKNDLENGKPGVLSILKYFEQGYSKIILVQGKKALIKADIIKDEIRKKYIDNNLMIKNNDGEIIHFPPNFLHASTDVDELKNDVKVFFPEWKFRVDIMLSKYKDLSKKNAPERIKYFK